jgi:hypothetical protein
MIVELREVRDVDWNSLDSQAKGAGEEFDRLYTIWKESRISSGDFPQ